MTHDARAGAAGRPEVLEIRPRLAGRIGRIVLALTATLVSGTCFLVTFADEAGGLAGARDQLGGATILSLALLFWAAAAWRSRLRIDADGVSRTRAFTTRRVPWSDVEGVRHGYFRCEVLAASDGHPLRVPFDGSEAQIRAAIELVVRRAPRLRAFAWGLGLDGIDAPRGGALPLPDRIQVFGDLVEIQGPGRMLLRLNADRPEDAARIGHVRERLARMVLERPRPGA